MAGCTLTFSPEAGSSSVDPTALRNKTWQWIATDTPSEHIEVPNPERYTIQFSDDGKLQAQFDCNRGGGTYQIDGGKLTFGPLLSTRVGCPPNSLDSQFMEDLQEVESFSVRDGQLFLELAAEAGAMRFRPAP